MVLLLMAPDIYAYSLKDAIASSLKNNQRVQISKKQLEIAILKKPKVAAEFLPSVNARLAKSFVKYKQFDGIPYTENDPQGSLVLNIEQNIFSGGSSVAKAIAADAEVNAAYQQYAKELNDTIYKSIESYQSVLTLRELVKVQEKSVEMGEKSAQKAELNVESGAETKTSLSVSLANLAALKSDLESYKVQKAQVEASFLYYIGEEAPSDMESIDATKYQKIATLNDFQSLVNQKNPELLFARQQLRASKQGVNIAASRLAPRVSLFADILRQDGPVLSTNGVQLRKDGDTYGIRMDIPIFNNGGADYIAISEAKKEKQKFDYSLRDTVERIKAEAVSTWDQYTSSINVYNLALQSEQHYYQTYLGVQLEFEVGAKTIFSVIDRERDYNTSVLNRLRREEENKLALFKIYKLIGNLPEVINS
ncbi:TolC family protein [Candidatus Bandiella woodruffii]|uniref:TolC family protein n=1 Tax=Candidatus Bandiella euplotis TaxID=1664265 RepID=A0ABZ0ULQ2_9RICK|nr:TolC family protein [Candidatus Bandiella woodruffii]